MSYTCLNVSVCAPALGLFNAICHQGLVRLEGKKKKKASVVTAGKCFC